LQNNDTQMNFAAWQSMLDEVIREPENRWLEKAVEDGKVPIGYTCSYVPRVLLSLDGLIPVRMRAPGVVGTEIADIYLSNVTCSYTRSLLEHAMDDRYDFLGGWVFAAGCDHVRRLLDNLDYLISPEFTHIIDAPHRQGDAALGWYIKELEILLGKLSDHFEVDTGKEALQSAIVNQNRFHRVLQSIADLRKKKHPPMSGTEFQRIMISSLTTPRDDFEDTLHQIKNELSKQKGISDYRARLMVVGGNIDDTEFIHVIESTGGLVVADRFCTGSMPGLSLMDEDKDSLTEIAEKTLSETSCPRMMEDFTSRLRSILHTAREYEVDGVIVEHLKFCDIWGIESSLMMDGLRDAGIPALRLERDYQLTGEGQLRTRIQAFLERMKK
jgi:benzoyl-CoA reductase/2-hydroxyglutaryl-CoA dehydratase subunit BcrC/BadD/HgdB